MPLIRKFPPTLVEEMRRVAILSTPTIHPTHVNPIIPTTLAILKCPNTRALHAIQVTQAAQSMANFLGRGKFPAYLVPV